MAVNIYAPTAQDTLSLPELDLYHRIMDYRASVGLAPVPLSKALTTTAGRHVVDARENIWGAGLTLPPGTNLHSWSDAPYYEDGRAPQAMWEAPQRLGTGYPSSGYEIAAAGQSNAAAALEGWKGSPGHNALLTETGTWSSPGFAAIGVGLETAAGAGPYNGHVYFVWFGEVADPTGPPDILGTRFADAAVGTAFADRMFGGAGADILQGAGGADLISGGAGADRIYGGVGADMLTGNTGNDQLLGGPGNDRLSGDAGADLLAGAAGNDVLLGRSGADRLSGGIGNDLLIGGPGPDQLVGNLGADLLLGSAGNDILSGGAGADRLSGGSGNDLLVAGPGPDRLAGNSGADRLEGGLAHDVLIGGPGADVFAFTSSASAGSGAAADVILDFAKGVDHIDLSAIDADPTTPGNQAFGFFGGGALPGEPGSLTAAAGVVSGDLDGDGASGLSDRLIRRHRARAGRLPALRPKGARSSAV